VKKKQSEFMCDAEYRNVLPDVPFEPKLQLFPLPPERLYRYVPALDDLARLEIYTDSDMGVPIDLIDIQKYRRPAHVEEGKMHPDDEALFPAIAEKEKKFDMKSNLAHIRNQSFSWLRKPDYIANTYEAAGTGKQRSVARSAQENAIKLQESKSQQDLPSQIALIERTFDTARRPPVHPKNKDLTPVEILSVVPDASIIHKFSLVRFDKDNRERLTDRGSVLKKESDQHYGVYWLHSEEDIAPQPITLKPHDTETDVTHYRWHREYRTKPSAQPDPENSFFFVLSAATKTLSYARFEARLNLKRRAKTYADSQAAAEISTRPESLTLHKIDPSKPQPKEQTTRSRPSHADEDLIDDDEDDDYLH